MLEDKIDLNDKALSIRKKLGEDSESPIDIFPLTGQIPELTLVLYPMSKNISGICLKNDGVNLIAVNTNMSYGRQRFSLAHELYHYFYDTSEGDQISTKLIGNEQKNDVEKNADQFASYFLAPYSALKSRATEVFENGEITLEKIISLEQLYGMSHLAMIWRLVTDGFIPKEMIHNYSEGVIAAATRCGYDDKLYKPTDPADQYKTYGSYIKKAENLYNEGLISKGKWEELLLDAYRSDIVYGSEVEDIEID